MNWIGLAIGAAMGAALGYTMKCSTGTCPITNNWWIFAIIGALMGLTWNK